MSLCRNIFLVVTNRFLQISGLVRNQEKRRFPVVAFPLHPFTPLEEGIFLNLQTTGNNEVFNLSRRHLSRDVITVLRITELVYLLSKITGTLPHTDGEV